MISKLALRNVGPLPDREYRFGRRINALTGDNGLGKTFLLDLIWFAFSNEWPVFANPAMTTGNMARPARMDVKATLSYGICPGSKTNGTLCRLEFDRESQQWEGRGNNPKETGCVVYSLSDGSFCVWDPIRNGRKQRNRPNYDPSLVVTPHEVWQGQQKFDRSNVGGSKTYSTIQGIQADWMLWQTNPNSKELPVLKQLLEKISPDGMPIGIGEPQKVSLEEARVMPTLRFPYGDVPINLASAAFRRILTLAYILVWTYSEHVKASAFVGKKPTRRIVLLVDELDAHLHPKWQRMIMPTLLSAIETMVDSFGANDKPAEKPEVQIFTSTHSPLVMASLEDVFDAHTDKWFDFDFSGECREVCCEERPLVRIGGAEDWLRSVAFDLTSTRSKGMEQMLNMAADKLQCVLEKCNEQIKVKGAVSDKSQERELRKIYSELAQRLSPTDSFLVRFRLLCESRGWNVQ